MMAVRIQWVPSLAPLSPAEGWCCATIPRKLWPSLAGGPFFCLFRDRGRGGRHHRARSVATTAIPAAVHEALGVVACRYAAQLNNFSA
jgi:hypothetical protein